MIPTSDLAVALTYPCSPACKLSWANREGIKETSAKKYSSQYGCGCCLRATCMILTKIRRGPQKRPSRWNLWSQTYWTPTQTRWRGKAEECYTFHIYRRKNLGRCGQEHFQHLTGLSRIQKMIVHNKVKIQNSPNKMQGHWKSPYQWKTVGDKNLTPNHKRVVMLEWYKAAYTGRTIPDWWRTRYTNRCCGLSNA